MATIDVIFLGAGESYSGTVPSALKSITRNRKALDWQLQSLERTRVDNINFIGGFHVEDVVEEYPQLNYTIVPDWRHNNIIHTLLQSPFRSRKDSLILYSDTLFRPKTIETFSCIDSDVVIAIDSAWLTRFENRSEDDISSSEIIDLTRFDQPFLQDNRVEFTGLLKLSDKAIKEVKKVDSAEVTNMVELIEVLYKTGLSFHFYDVQGDWTEFNSDLDIARFILGTKSETLYRIFPLVKNSVIGQQVTFTVQEWRNKQSFYVDKIQCRFKKKPLIIRSSSFAEDCWNESHAGGFESVLNVDSQSTGNIIESVEKVIASYQDSNALRKDQILVQEYLSHVKMAGVVFTRSLETGAPYYRINFDDQTQSTASVTSGGGSELRTVIVSKSHREKFNHLCKDLQMVLEGVAEIESLLSYDKLDIEFAIDTSKQLHIFQVRPISVNHQKTYIDDNDIKSTLDECVKSFHAEQYIGPNIVGDDAYFGVMPDWNPAEIIGVKPKPLAYSLYRFLIADQIWALQRKEFGYRDVSQYPLIRTFVGQPYVSIRNSLNSFIPASVSDQAANRICNAYLTLLKEKSHLHDKIEFDVALTVLTPDFEQNAQTRFSNSDVTADDINELKIGLHQITQNAFKRLGSDISSLSLLQQEREKIINSDASDLNKALLLLDDCKKHGTLAFSHAARAGFVAMTLLNSLVELNVISQTDKERFLASFNTVAGEFERDAIAVAKGTLSKQSYVDSYGHLRPGTYDITAKAYWENPDQYLFSKIDGQNHANVELNQYDLKSSQKQRINQLFLDMDLRLNADEFLNYCKEATQAREFVKFEFSKNLSIALDFLSQFGADHDLQRQQMAYLSLTDLQEYNLGVLQLSDLEDIIEAKKRRFALTTMIELPQLILSEADFYGFERNASEPNFVTSQSIEAECVCLADDSNKIKGKIVFIEQADPGYDWMFAYDLAGLITQYGGANSHMAIRAAELNLPAAIGVGDKIYEEFKSATIVRLNCGQKQIIRIK